MAPSNLVSGSVWQRQRKNQTTLSLVLYVTNEGLTGPALDDNPQQVVFRTEQGKILSMSIADFTAKRTYAIMDNQVADHLAQLDSILEESLDEEEQDMIDSVVADETLFAPETPPSTTDSADSPVVAALTINVGPHPLATALQSNLVAYSESPYFNGDTLHTLKFRMQNVGGMSLADVRSAFQVSDPNSIQKFEVSTSVEKFQVEIYGFLDVMLEADQNGNYACLYVTSEGDFRAPAEEVVDMSVVVEPAVSSSVTVTVS